MKLFDLNDCILCYQYDTLLQTPIIGGKTLRKKERKNDRVMIPCRLFRFDKNVLFGKDARERFLAIKHCTRAPAGDRLVQEPP